MVFFTSFRYRLVDPAHEGYSLELKSSVNTLRIGELVKAFFAKNQKAGYERMMQMVSKRAETLGGKQAAGRLGKDQVEHVPTPCRVPSRWRF